MVVIRWRWKNVWTRLRQNILWKISQASLTFRSITYNEHMSQSYAIDVLLGPIFWFVDNFAGYLGRVIRIRIRITFICLLCVLQNVSVAGGPSEVFVFCVTVLTSMVVLIAYWVGLPYWWQLSSSITVVLVIFGNWLLLNIVFHYYMGVTTAPGCPPHGIMIKEAASICKKCIRPKPPRTHHCSVCDACILCMDHHCPWLNNCVGYYNARYFFLYMLYMLVGVTFIIIFGLDIGYHVLWLNDTGGIIPNNDPDLIGHPVRINKSGAIVPIDVVVEYDEENSPRVHDLPIPPITEAQRITAHPLKRKAVIFMAATCVPTFFALGTLVIMHAKNVSKGETSVESHINAKLRKKQNATFRNPYNFGRKKNWRIFLGLTQGRTFVRHILLPSSHKPAGNGLTWHTIHNVGEDWP